MSTQLFTSCASKICNKLSDTLPLGTWNLLLPSLEGGLDLQTYTQQTKYSRYNVPSLGEQVLKDYRFCLGQALCLASCRISHPEGNQFPCSEHTQAAYGEARRVRKGGLQATPTMNSKSGPPTSQLQTRLEMTAVLAKSLTPTLWEALSQDDPTEPIRDSCPWKLWDNKH